MPKRTTRRVLIVLHFLEMNYVDLVTFMRSVVLQLTGNLNVPTPIIPLATMTTQANTLDNTNVLRETDKSEALTTQAGNEANTCLNSLTSTANQVEDIANTIAAGNVDVAKQIINEIGFQVKKDADRTGRFFEVVNVFFGGVQLRTKALPKKPIYLWRHTTTPGDPQSWSPPIITFVTAVNLVELAHDTRHYFQSFVLENPGGTPTIDTDDNNYAWSDAISALVP